MVKNFSAKIIIQDHRSFVYKHHPLKRETNSLAPYLYVNKLNSSNQINLLDKKSRTSQTRRRRSIRNFIKHVCEHAYKLAMDNFCPRVPSANLYKNLNYLHIIHSLHKQFQACLVCDHKAMIMLIIEQKQVFHSQS